MAIMNEYENPIGDTFTVNPMGFISFYKAAMCEADRLVDGSLQKLYTVFFTQCDHLFWPQ